MYWHWQTQLSSEIIQFSEGDYSRLDELGGFRLIHSLETNDWLLLVGPEF